MPRCDNCGRQNPAVAAFCQDCGKRLEPAGADAPNGAGPSSPVPGQGGSTEVRCAGCGTTNPTGMTFCRQCGARLGEGEAPAELATIPCPTCGRATPSGFNYCQHCGFELASGRSAPAAPPTPPSGLPVSTSVEPAPSPVPSAPVPMARKRTPPGLGIVPAPVMGKVGPMAGVVGPGTPVGIASPVLTAPGHAGSVGEPTPVIVPNAVVGTIASDPSRPGAAPAPRVPRAMFRLVSVNRDGSDGVSFPVVGDRFDIGRRTGTLLFEDDGYLSDRHVRLEVRDGRCFLVDLDSLNGIYVRIRDREELRDRSRILVGMEVLRFELISEKERDPAPAVEHGVLVFGTPPKLPWARLRQLTTAGISRDVFHLYRAEVVIGRESGDVVFSDDDFMSRMHAAIRNEGGKAWLVDLNSSNGTYVQVYKERPIDPGDFIRLGDQLLRFESA